MANAPRATIDFETRSACDIKKCGGAVYSEHPSTQVMVLRYTIPGREGVGRWMMAFPQHGIEESPPPFDLFAWILDGGLVEAHNAFFERMIWKNICVARMGWPAIPAYQWRCSAAKASSFALPRSLGGLGAALRLPTQKSEDGRRVMLKLSKPRKPKKDDIQRLKAEGIDPKSVLLWNEDLSDIQALDDYCEGDVLSEHAASEFLRDLPPIELRTWHMDQALNERGVRIDMEFIDAALYILDVVVEQMNAELAEITNGAVTSGSSRVAFKEWVESRGYTLLDTQGATLDRWMADDSVPEDIRIAMQIVREVTRTSTKKFSSMKMYAAKDGRLHDLLMYHGASTGRWAGKGPQPHNFARGTNKYVTMDLDMAIKIFKTRDIPFIRMMFGPNIIEALASALRGAFIPSEGRRLMVADYAAIEARVVFWLAGDNTALDVFRSGEDIYCDMASGIYGYICYKKSHPDERQFGKQAILGLGFGMGFLTFLLTCRKYNIIFPREQVERIVGDQWDACEKKVLEYFMTDRRRFDILTENRMTYKEVLHEMVLMQFTVNKYRDRYPAVEQFWKDLENAAIMAVKNKGKSYYAGNGKIEYRFMGRFLYAKLPSGRLLAYCEPLIQRKRMPWKDSKGDPVYKPSLTFMGVDPYTRAWVRQDTYGGTLCENVVQAVARDLMRDAMLRIDDHPDYDLLLSVHDELIAEADLDKGSVAEFEALMAKTEPWAEGCPVAAEGWTGPRYKK